MGPTPLETAQRVETFTWQGKTIRYCTPNATALWRVNTLLSKEPSTIKWLCQIKRNEILFDVGANIGMYSLFAAICQEARVHSFEPESQNYALLNWNIFENQASDRIQAYCLACSDQSGFNPLYLSRFETGGSCHSLGEEVGFDLRPRQSGFTQGAYAITIDQAVESGAIPTPNHIKIDVDGFEHKVLLGASKTLNDSRVRSLIVEINPNLPEHLEIVFALSALGFEIDEAQVKQASRKEGPFQGVGEWIFTRSKESVHIQQLIQTVDKAPVLCTQTNRGKQVREYVLKQIRLTSIKTDPFPVSIVDNVFPEDYYQEILNNFPLPEQLIPLSSTGRTIGGSYEKRHIVLFNKLGFSRPSQKQLDFWSEFAAWLYHPEFISSSIDYLEPYVRPRLEALYTETQSSVLLSSDALIVSDQTSYAIGPHTDAPHRLISFLFYLPSDDSLRHLGTSLYKPKCKGMSCAGLKHHSHDGFERVATIDYIPNRLVLFPKTDSSFHGVEPIRDGSPERNLLINNIRLTK
jgi:FkbM family methyltransferase